MTRLKTVDELRRMTTEEIAEYVLLVDGESAEYAEWCGDALLTVLEERGIGDEEFAATVERIAKSE
jgi:hypothetical protein